MDVEMTVCNCATCGMSFAMPSAVNRRLHECHNAFYCPAGHSNYYPQKSKAEQLQEWVNEKERTILNLREQLRQAEAAAKAAKKPARKRAH